MRDIDGYVAQTPNTPKTQDTIRQHSSPGLLKSLLFKKVPVNKATPLSLIVHDAKRFLSSHSPALEKAPLQVYHSAMLFTPSASIIRKFYAHHNSTWLSTQPALVHNWSEYLQTFTPSEWVDALEFSSDGKMLASLTSQGIWLWDAKARTERHFSLTRLTGAELGRLQFSPDGKLLALRLPYDSTVQIWNIPAGRIQYVIEESGHPLHNPKYPRKMPIISPNGTIMATTTVNHTIRLWNSTTSLDISVLAGHMDWITVLAFSPDSKSLASGSKDKTVRIWDVSTGLTRFVLQCHLDAVCALSFSPDGRLLASGSADRTICLWNLLSGLSEFLLQGHSAALRMVAFSPGGNFLVSNVIEGTVQRVLPPLTSVYAVSLSSDVLLLATADRAGITVRDIATEQVLFNFRSPYSVLKGLKFSPDGQLLASASVGGTVHLWDIGLKRNSNAQIEGAQPSHMPEVVDFSSDKNILVSHPHLIRSRNEESIRIWDLRSNTQRIIPWKGDTCALFEPLAVSPDGRLVAFCPIVKGIRLWDLQTGKRLPEVRGKPINTSTLKFSPDSKFLASADANSVWISDLATNTTRMVVVADDYDPANILPRKLPLRAPLKTVVMAFSPDCQMIACESKHGIKLCNLATGAEKRVLDGRLHFIETIEFSPDGKILAFGCNRKELHLCDTRTGEARRLRDLNLHVLKEVVFSRDGNLIACVTDKGSSGHSVWILDVTTLREVGKVETDVKLKYVSFSSCGTYLMTDRGGLLIPGLSCTHAPLYASEYWIQRGNENILFIHSEWRHSIYFVSGNDVAFMNDTREVILIRFDPPETDQGEGII
ncbi:WD-repeat protein [Penicillium vulpinum]|uniref:WD-repeat protein n=1 Tax=Penicillium vulpinum TaxID=29845 RepID=UPI0025479059|nr:WD-repeat protein [Penicillium vulpinum]KAJ5970535.1 WD-repeat protein [Penicillium vulpinum]